MHFWLVFLLILSLRDWHETWRVALFGLCAAEEDFGIAIVEAQAAGCPVITYGSGGSLETVIDGVTGLLFAEQSSASLMEAILNYETSFDRFHTADLIQNAQRFSQERFKQEFQGLIEQS